MSFNDHYNMFNPAITQKVVDEQYLNNVQPPSITFYDENIYVVKTIHRKMRTKHSQTKKKYIEGHKNEGCILLCFL